MSTMNISLPDDLRAFVEEHVAEEGYASSSEYIRELIRDDRRKAHIRKLLLDGKNSSPGPVADESYFQRLRERVERRATQ
jgi:antitoxin ParD1/3/4